MVGSVLRIMVAEEDPNAVLERIAYPQTRIVSLTITEKGYSHEPSTGYLRWDDPDILRPGASGAPAQRHRHPDLWLALRRERRLPPLTLLSCDNLHANGDTLCNLVLAFALRLDVTLAAWIDKNCTFPNSMVDRIVPGTLDEDRARISARLGFEDAWPVVGEPYLNWVIEDKFAAGRPAWDLPGGATFVRNAAPYERLKLRMVNAPHSAWPIYAGHAHRQRAAQDPALRRYAEDLMRLEIAPSCFPNRACAFMARPIPPCRLQQIAMDGSQKVPQRLLGAIRDRLRRGDDCARLVLAVAAWLHYLRGHDERGDAYVVQDPLADALARLLSRADVAAAAAPRRRAARRGAGRLQAGVRRPGQEAGLRAGAGGAAGAAAGAGRQGSIGGTGAGTGLMCRGSPACAQGSPR